MLNRIFWFTSAAAMGAVWMLRENLPQLELLLTQIDFTLEFGGDKIVPIPGGYLLPALAVGLASRVFRIHGQLASRLGIRERFDVDVIIHELATRVGVDLRGLPDDELVYHRHEIMRRCFYSFVSGSEPQVDVHLTHRALDLWSWFWIGIEAAFVFVVSGFVLISAGVYPTGFIVILVAATFAAVGLPAIRSECKRYAIAQVRAIVSDKGRAAEVRQVLDSLLTCPPDFKRAA